MEIRNETLEIYEDLSNRLKVMDDSELENSQIKRLNPIATLPFWNMLNGPISDSLTHVGQVTSWRRIAGNPQLKGVDPFSGKKS